MYVAVGARLVSPNGLSSRTGARSNRFLLKLDDNHFSRHRNPEERKIDTLSCLGCGQQFSDDSMQRSFAILPLMFKAKPLRQTLLRDLGFRPREQIPFFLFPLKYQGPSDPFYLILQ